MTEPRKFRKRLMAERRADFVCWSCGTRRATHDALDRHGREARHSVHVPRPASLLPEEGNDGET